MQRKITKQSGRHAVSRFLHARNDKEAIAGWKSDLNGILNVFNVRSVLSLLVAANCSPIQTELAMNTHTIVADMHHNVLKIREDIGNQNQEVSDSRAI